MAKQVFNYEFEELPLVIEGGFEAGLIAGSAEVSYFRDGEWTITGIYLDGLRMLSPSERDDLAEIGKPPPFFDRKSIALDAGTSLFNSILHRLEHEWRGKVQDAVNDAIDEDRAADADDAADYRRDFLREAV
ncbi:MAG: hypothetical protein J0I08_23500 [Rhizobiales bacterium]|nr:hypothetical protein [Hyphomicrobiales bacterium]